MMHIVINKTNYPLPQCWEELTIAQGKWVQEEVQKMNKCSAMDRNEARKKLNHEEAVESIEMLCLICNVPQQIALQTIEEERKQLKARWLAHFGTVPLTSTTLKKQTESFVWDNERLYYPKSGNALDGTTLPMQQIEAGAFCTASDLLNNDPIGYSALITAILCRPAQEAYEEKRVTERASKLEQMPLSYAWLAIEQLRETHRTLKRWFPYCYASPLDRLHRKACGQGEKTESVTWDDLMMEGADYRVETLRMVEQMPLYDFMRLLNSKFKRLITTRQS